MADSGASVRLDLAEVERLLGGLAIRGGDLSGLMDDLGAQIEFETSRHFETERDPDGNPWPPSLRALSEGGQTLSLTGRLRQSITRRTTATSVEVGTNVVYAAIHQFGGTIKREARQQTLYWHFGKGGPETFRDWRFVKKSKANYSETHTVKAHTTTMPARPYLGVGTSTLSALGEIARDWLAGSGGAP